MKVSVNQTVEVTDEQRKEIAAELGQKTATRDDLKAYLWEHGRRWEDTLPSAHRVEPEEDLLGDVDLDDLL